MMFYSFQKAKYVGTFLISSATLFNRMAPHEGMHVYRLLLILLI